MSSLEQTRDPLAPPHDGAAQWLAVKPLRPPLPKPVELVVFALCVAHAVYLIAAYVMGYWIFQTNGYIETDFVNAWAAGKLVLQGMPTAIYDIAAHKQAEIAALGHDFDGAHPWFYPPTYLFVAIALAALPYPIAWLGFIFATFAFYLAAIRAIVADRVGLALACAFPAVLQNFLIGQNGFLTAALLGGTLVTMERRPWLSGCLLGLMTYKPHFGLLLPLVLVVGGQWQVLIAATATTIVLIAGSWLAFGASTWATFIHALGTGSQMVFADGSVAWGKLQTIYGLTRWLGGSQFLAWSAQGLVITACGVAVCLLWRSKLPFALKTAALATAVLLSTPYLLLYDLVAVAVPMAFLVRAGYATQRGIARLEWAALGIASLAIMLYPAFEAPVGVMALFIVVGLIARRVIDQRSSRGTADTPFTPGYSGSA
jgi:arabinofuranan 3-O-arabinosyltransferase